MLVLLAAACATALTGTGTAQAQASAPRHARSTRAPTARSSIELTVSAAHGLVPLAWVVDGQKTRRALRLDASDEPNFDNLRHVIVSAANIAGLGFAVVAIAKFKAHKDNPPQTVLGKPTALVFTGASIPSIDRAAAIAGASVFAQASEARAVAAGERNQAGATPTRGELPPIARPAQPPAPPPRTSSQNRRLRRLIALEHALFLDETRLARASQAEVTAVRHSSTAAKAGDRIAYSRDRTAVIRSLRQEARLLEQLATVRRRAAATFAALGIGLRATHGGMVKLAAYSASTASAPHAAVSGAWASGPQASALPALAGPSSPASFALGEVGSFSPASSPAWAARPPPTCAWPGCFAPTPAPSSRCGSSALWHPRLCRDRYEAVGRSSFGA